MWKKKSRELEINKVPKALGHGNGEREKWEKKTLHSRTEEKQWGLKKNIQCEKESSKLNEEYKLNKDNKMVRNNGK